MVTRRTVRRTVRLAAGFLALVVLRLVAGRAAEDEGLAYLKVASLVPHLGHTDRTISAPVRIFYTFFIGAIFLALHFTQ